MRLGIGIGLGMGGGATAPAPIITSVSPDLGFVAGGTTITIRGSHFTGATAAHFGGGLAGSFVVVNDTTITCTTPALSAVALATVTVTGPGGVGSLASAWSCLPACQVCLVADYGVTLNGSTVSAWADQSGSANNVANAASATQPTYVASDSGIGGRASVTGAASVLLRNATLTLAAPFAWFLVLKANTWTHGGGTVVADVTAMEYGMIFQYLTTPTFELYSGTDGPDTGSDLALGTYGVMTAIVDGVSSSTQINGLTARTGNAGASGYSGGFGLFEDSQSRAGLDGSLAAAILVSGHPSASDAGVIRSYLDAHYGSIY